MTLPRVYLNSFHQVASHNNRAFLPTLSHSKHFECRPTCSIIRSIASLRPSLSLLSDNVISKAEIAQIIQIYLSLLYLRHPCFNDSLNLLCEVTLQLLTVSKEKVVKNSQNIKPRGYKL